MIEVGSLVAGGFDSNDSGVWLGGDNHTVNPVSETGFKLKDSKPDTTEGKANKGELESS
jgi:hypothetical protein